MLAQDNDNAVSAIPLVAINDKVSRPVIIYILFYDLCSILPRKGIYFSH